MNTGVALIAEHSSGWLLRWLTYFQEAHVSFGSDSSVELRQWPASTLFTPTHPLSTYVVCVLFPLSIRHWSLCFVCHYHPKLLIGFVSTWCRLKYVIKCLLLVRVADWLRPSHYDDIVQLNGLYSTRIRWWSNLGVVYNI